LKGSPFIAERFHTPTPEKRCYVTLTIRRMYISHSDVGRTIDITAEENETVERLKQRILVEFGTPGRRVNLNHRLKLLTDKKTLKQENIESGDILDAMILMQTSGSFGGLMVDDAEFSLGDSPAYS
jgi:hypothetical protein